MNCPQGINGATDQDALKLQECIYGLVQEARKYHKKMVEALKGIGFEGVDVNPCLYKKQDKYGLIDVALYVYDNLLIGNQKAINETIKVLKSLVLF